MRRKVITMIVVGALLAALSAVEQISVQRITGSALTQTAAIMDAVRAGDLNEAMQKAHALDEAWDKEANMIEMIINHSSTDDVRFALSRLIASLESGDRSSAMIYASELEGGIEHVLERQELSPQNML